MNHGIHNTKQSSMQNYSALTLRQKKSAQFLQFSPAKTANQFLSHSIALISALECVLCSHVQNFSDSAHSQMTHFIKSSAQKFESHKCLRFKFRAKSNFTWKRIFAKKKNKVDENRTLTTSNCLKNNNKGLCFVATKLNTILNDHEFIKKMINDSTNSLRVATPSQNRNHKMAENHLSTDCNGFCDDSNGRKMFTTIKFIYNFMMIEHVYQLAGALAWTVKQNQ